MNYLFVSPPDSIPENARKIPKKGAPEGVP